MLPERPKPQDIAPYLREADFSAPVEVGLRYLLVAVLAGLVWYVADVREVPLWLAAYATTEALYYAAVRRAPGPAPRLCAAMALGAYCLSALCFLALPMYMTHDPRPLVMAGGIVGQMGFLIYMLYRVHRLTLIAAFDSVLMLLFAVNITATLVPMMQDLWEQVILGALIHAIVIYAIMALWRSLHNQTTLDLNERRARRSDRMDTVARLTGGVAHDFNNILTVILGNLELYHHAETQGERDILVREAAEAGHRGAHLISQLLAFSGRAPMAPEVAPMKDHVESALPLVQRLVPAHVTLRLDLTRDDGMIAVDRGQFTAALLNLVANATDAIGEARGRVLISCWPLPDRQEGAQVVLSVSDTGGGVPEDIADRVLEPYFTTKGVGEGSGLGLSMVNGFAEQSGGRLELHNRPGEGLTVALVLPAAPRAVQPDADAGAPRTERATAPAAPAPAGSAQGTARGDLPT